MIHLPTWIICNKDKVLSVDKKDCRWETVTVLPYWEVFNWEKIKAWLIRSFYSRLWIDNVDVRKKFFRIRWCNIGKKAKATIDVYDTYIWDSEIKPNWFFSNPRYLYQEELLDLETTTDLTKRIIDYLITLDFNLKKHD